MWDGIKTVFKLKFLQLKDCNIWYKNFIWNRIKNSQNLTNLINIKYFGFKNEKNKDSLQNFIEIFSKICPCYVLFLQNIKVVSHLLLIILDFSTWEALNTNKW